MRPGQTDHRSEGEHLVRGTLVSEEGLGNRRVPHAWAGKLVWLEPAVQLAWGGQGGPAGGKRKGVCERWSQGIAGAKS